jgi:hypothetical protein
MARSRTDRFLFPLRPGARTGVGTYINYLIGASVLAAAALAGALATRPAKTPERTERTERTPRRSEGSES